MFPSSMKIKCAVENVRTEKAITACKNKWLSEERKQLYTKLTYMELNLYNTQI